MVKQDAEALIEAEGKLDRDEEALLRATEKVLGLYEFSDLVIGVQECYKSPVGWCLYRDGKDSNHDHCLCCGDPHERK